MALVGGIEMSLSPQVFKFLTVLVEADGDEVHKRQIAKALEDPRKLQVRTSKAACGGIRNVCPVRPEKGTTGCVRISCFQRNESIRTAITSFTNQLLKDQMWQAKINM
ncbi:MAG: hypothetical protein IPK34_08535 [Ramlibacter sp.]|nr:hypothetical protein [Ramlibacter sp.]